MKCPECRKEVEIDMDETDASIQCDKCMYFKQYSLEDLYEKVFWNGK